MVQKIDMIMPILLKIRKQKMFTIRVCALTLFIVMTSFCQGGFAKTASKGVDLKTIKASLPSKCARSLY
jgi:hypothetical protein